MITNLSSVCDCFVKVLMIFIDADTRELLILFSLSISYRWVINVQTVLPMISPSYHGIGRLLVIWHINVQHDLALSDGSSSLGRYEYNST